MTAMDSADATGLQATLLDFAIAELVRQHRESFQPIWTVDSWVKLLIWLSLNCGCPGDEAGMTSFADALGPTLTGRMRRLFFERELEDLDLKVMADPAEQQVLILPMGPGVPLNRSLAGSVIKRIGLEDDVVTDQDRWQELDAVLAIPRRAGER